MTPHRMVPLEDILRDYVPGSFDQPWSWDDEREWLDNFASCCETPGCYQARLEKHLRERGRIEQPVCLGDDGRVWDGHHRIVAARRLGLTEIPVETFD